MDRIKGLWRRVLSVGLRTKIAGIVAAVVVALSLGGFFVLRANLSGVLERRLEAHALTVAMAVASHYADASHLESTETSHDLIQAMVDTDPEVLYAIVQDANGEVQIQASRSGAPQERLGAIPLLDPPTDGVVSMALPSGRVIEAVEPVHGLGLFARVGLTTSLVGAEIARMGERLAVVAAVGLILAVVFSLVLTRWFTRPILSLQRAVRHTSLDNLPDMGDGGRGDEIGELTQAFSSMMAGLARSRDTLVARNRELAVLNATAQAIGGSMELGEILQSALEAILREMDMQAGWVLLSPGGREGRRGSIDPEPDGADRPLVFTISSGLSPRFAAEESERDWDGCLCLKVLASGECRVVGNIEEECPRLSRQTILEEGLITHASVPLVARDRVVGVLNVACSSARTFQAHELRLLTLIGRQIGVAVDNSRLWDQVQRKEHLRSQFLERTLRAQEEERRRIALELHDQFGSSLASLGVGLRILEDRQRMARNGREEFRALRDQVAQIARDLHQLAFDLRPPALDRLGLAEAIEQAVHECARRHGLEADFQAIGLDGDRLPNEVETALYRIVQEALTNVAKHAQATEVGVLLERRADTIVAVIEDNGLGFIPTEALSKDLHQLGLFGMQERAALVGGRWSVESTPGEGTTVFLEVPLSAAS